jgi:hypothetical protein
MLSLKNKYIACLIILNAVLVIALLLFWDTVFKDVKPLVWTMVAIALFFVYELITILITEKKGNTITPRQSVNLFLGMKVGKILLSLIFITAYVVVVKIELKSFILLFIVLYFVYFLFDTLYLASREKKRRTKN